MSLPFPFIFIIGSPRSGTTLLGNILDRHPVISQWFEPYFVWDRYFRDAPHDERTSADARPEIIRQIYRDFLRYRKKSRGGMVVDKSPRNSLKIPFIRQIFPDAFFIHLLRDGRDATLSINKEWLRRNRIVFGEHRTGFDLRKAFETAVDQWINKQPMLVDKLRAIWFETHGHLSGARQLHRTRWNGRVGWGPRFPDWETFFETHSLLEFNAMQWLKCIEHIRMNWEQIPDKNKIEIRYEELTENPGGMLKEIFEKLKTGMPGDFTGRIPVIKKNNFNKWRQEFSSEDLNRINGVLGPMIEELGY